MFSLYRIVEGVVELWTRGMTPAEVLRFSWLEKVLWTAAFLEGEGSFIYNQDRNERWRLKGF